MIIAYEIQAAWMKVPDWNPLAPSSVSHLDISVAPCHECRYWFPRIVISPDINLHGIQLCSLPSDRDQERDFSCFKPSPTELEGTTDPNPPPDPEATAGKKIQMLMKNHEFRVMQSACPDDEINSLRSFYNAIEMLIQGNAIG